MGDGEAIRRRYRAGKQDLAGRVCVSFLIADDDGRQISEAAAAVKNCRRDWKTHFGRERGERKRGGQTKRWHFLTTAAASLSAAKPLGGFVLHAIFLLEGIERYQNITLSPAESADVLLMLGRREEGGGVIPAPSDAPGVSLSLPLPAKRSDR